MTDTPATPTDRDGDGDGDGDGHGEGDGRYRPTLGALSHTHPSTDERFGQTQAYARGPAVAADGGARDGDGNGAADRLRDVDHEVDDAGEATQRTHERGRRGRRPEEGV